MNCEKMSIIDLRSLALKTIKDENVREIIMENSHDREKLEYKLFLYYWEKGDSDKKYRCIRLKREIPGYNDFWEYVATCKTRKEAVPMIAIQKYKRNIMPEIYKNIDITSENTRRLTDLNFASTYYLITGEHLAEIKNLISEYIIYENGECVEDNTTNMFQKEIYNVNRF